MNIIAAVKSSVALSAVVSSAVKLTRIAGLLKGCCPIHGEKTPSFVVYSDHFHCYGCGAHGDVVDFVRLIQKVDHREAMRILGANNTLAVSAPAPSRPVADEWHPMPMPPGARAPNLREFDHVYTYRDTAGEVLRYICRIDGPPKRIIPLTYGKLRNSIGWHRKHAKERYLYGAEKLLKNPSATVIVTEGEKAADAAQVLFPTRISVTWSGGAQAFSKTDFSALAGRRVILWPDNDASGHEAMKKIGDALKKISCRIATLSVSDLSPGDDAADVLPKNPESWLKQRIIL